MEGNTDMMKTSLSCEAQLRTRKTRKSTNMNQLREYTEEALQDHTDSQESYAQYQINFATVCKD
jgi:hypothetical protein